MVGSEEFKKLLSIFTIETDLFKVFLKSVLPNNLLSSQELKLIVSLNNEGGSIIQVIKNIIETKKKGKDTIDFDELFTQSHNLKTIEALVESGGDLISYMNALSVSQIPKNTQPKYLCNSLTTMNSMYK